MKKSVELQRTDKELFQKWACSEEYIFRLENCANALYESETTFFEEKELHRPGPLTVKVKRKKEL